jgi:hypothetical protein
MKWASKVLGEIKSEERAKSLESKPFVEEQRLLRHHAPRLWMKLRGLLEKKCKLLNLELGKHIFRFELVPSSQALIMKADRPTCLKVEFSADGCWLHYECGDLHGEFLFRVNVDATVVMESRSGIPFTLDQVSEKLLEVLQLESSASR